MVILKKDKKLEYWPRLTKEKAKNAFLKTDFSKWVDEDEQDGEPAIAEEPDLDMGGMGGMGGLGGMGGMGGMDFEKVSTLLYEYFSYLNRSSFSDDGADGWSRRVGRVGRRSV